MHHQSRNLYQISRKIMAYHCVIALQESLVFSFSLTSVSSAVELSSTQWSVHWALSFSSPGTRLMRQFVGSSAVISTEISL